VKAVGKVERAKGTGEGGKGLTHWIELSPLVRARCETKSLLCHRARGKITSWRGQKEDFN